MAASNAPKNDFAPPWLSFPDSNDSTRPIGSRSTPILERPRQRREDAYYTRYGGDYPRPLNRQNSGTDVYDGSKRHSPSHASKHRIPALEEDYYYYSNYGYLAYYPYPDPYPMHFAAHPTALPRRDAKFPSPSYARYGQVNGSYPAYSNFDFYPSGDGFSNYGGGGRDSVRRSQYAREGRGESRESRDSDRSSHDGEDKDKIFNDDFPSLNGTDDDTDARTSRHASSGGVWDNPPRSKLEDTSSEGKSSTSALYRVMPSKNGSSVRKDSRDGGRLNGSVRDASPLASIKSGSGREGQRQSPTPAKEILSTQMVRPKPTDKKSQFLKTLRKAEMENGMQNGVGHHHQESNNNLKKGEEEAEVVMNGVNDLQLEQDLDQQCNGSIKILSSSMEREYSFLFSLGWDPQAETELITEDEKREFLNRSGKVKEEQQRNGRTRMLPKSWSPQHLVGGSPTQPQPEMNETLSSSDSSDEDL